jgi:hypothetical protein
VRSDPLDHDPGELRERAAELLSRPPYREEQGLFDRLWETLREWLAEGLSRILGLVSGDATMGWVVVALGVLVLLAVVWRATRGLTLDRAVEERPIETGGGYTAAQWRDHAEEQARNGRYDEAVRGRYLALVTGLAEGGTVEDVPARTVGELQRELETVAPLLAPAAGQAGAIFAEVFYGRQPATPAQYDRLASLASEVERRTGSRVTAGPAPGVGVGS